MAIVAVLVRPLTVVGLSALLIMPSTTLADSRFLSSGERLAERGGMPAIPLCPGLQIVTSVSESNGDYESIKTIESMDEKAVRLRYSNERLDTDLLSSNCGKLRKSMVYRNVLLEDLKTSLLYEQRFHVGMAETIPGSTAIGVSAAALQALRSGAELELQISNAYSGDIPVDRSVRPNIYDYVTSGRLRLVAAEPIAFAVLVNNVETLLPAIHVAGDFAGDAAEFFFLDDPENPLTLKFRIGIGAVPPMIKEMVELCRVASEAAPDIGEAMCGNTQGGDREVLQVTKISFSCPIQASAMAGADPRAGAVSIAGIGARAPEAGLSAGAQELEKVLRDADAFVVYDIHFTFNSAEIRPESEARLQEIAGVLQRNPDWRLLVTGHTDSVASDAYNLDLSARRAEAVTAALVARFGIDSARLRAQGVGETQPRDTNETLEGRARNRRVELLKL